MGDDCSVDDYKEYLDYKHLGESDVNVVKLMDKILDGGILVYLGKFSTLCTSDEIVVDFQTTTFISDGTYMSGRDLYYEVTVDVSIVLQGNKVVDIESSYLVADGDAYWDVRDIDMTDELQMRGITVGCTL